VREYPNLNKPFLDSIAERGVVVPLTAIRHHDGAVEVRNGQRRTMAARKLRLSTVPVYLLPATAADTAAETIDRIVHQMVTNDHPCDLTDAQRARGIQQMIERSVRDEGPENSPAQVCTLHRRAAACVGGSTNPRRRQLLIDLLVSRTELRHTEVGGDMAPAGGRVQRRRPLDRGR
jgi:hypothetical protein